jgi:hypothetical protein
MSYPQEVFYAQYILIGDIFTHTGFMISTGDGID